MRVLTLSWEFPPRIVGGISTHVYHLSRALCNNGTAVHVITCDFPGCPPEEVVDGVRVSRVDISRVAQGDFLLWAYRMNSLMIERAAEILENLSFELIHAHDWMVGRAAIELKNRYHIPLITTIHATEIGRAGGVDNTQRKKIHNIERLLVCNSEAVICCSSYMARNVQKNLGVSTDKTHVIPNAVDVSRFDVIPESGAIRKKLQRGERKLVLYVGRLVREKGLQTLLDAFEILLKENIRARLVIVGEGPVKEELMEKVLSNGMHDHVHFTGFVDEASLVSLYKSSDVFVLPSLYEPFGIVALEAMASGVPVVVSDVGGLSEIVENGLNGLKVPAADSKSLAAALQLVLQDSTFAERLRNNAYQYVHEKFDWNYVACKTLEAYRATVRTNPSSAAVSHEDFISDNGVLHILLTSGAAAREGAKSAREIAAMIGAPEVPVKLMIGRQVSHGYVSTLLATEFPEVRYHLSETGIIKAYSIFS